MSDAGLNSLLKWAIENTESVRENAGPDYHPTREPDIEAKKAFLAAFTSSYKSQAQIMQEMMETIEDNSVPWMVRDTAWEGFELMVGHIDNANNLVNILKDKNAKKSDNPAEKKPTLWDALLGLLEDKDPENRQNAASCIATAVQNNKQVQERLLVSGAIPRLVKLATEEENKIVRKKAINAISSVSRNFQPGLDEVVQHLPKKYKPKKKIDSGEMDRVNEMIEPMRADVRKLN